MIGILVTRVEFGYTNEQGKHQGLTERESVEKQQHTKERVRIVATTRSWEEKRKNFGRLF